MPFTFDFGVGSGGGGGFWDSWGRGLGDIVTGDRSASTDKKLKVLENFQKIARTSGVDSETWKKYAKDHKKIEGMIKAGQFPSMFPSIPRAGAVSTPTSAGSRPLATPPPGAPRKINVGGLNVPKTSGVGTILRGAGWLGTAAAIASWIPEDWIDYSKSRRFMPGAAGVHILTGTSAPRLPGRSLPMPAPVKAAPVAAGARTRGTPAAPGNPPAGAKGAAKPAATSITLPGEPWWIKLIQLLPPLAAAYLGRAPAPRAAPGSALTVNVSPFAESPPAPFDDADTLTRSEAESADCACTPKQPKPKKPRRSREVCYSGTFIERQFGINKTRKRKTPCRPFRKKLP